MSLNDAQIADLVTALLTVNRYPLDRAAALMPTFRDQGLLDPRRLLAMSGGEVVRALNDAGYQRGGYVNVIAFRLHPIMEAIAAGQLDGLPPAVEVGDKVTFTATLQGVYGFGPRTIEAAWLLWSTPRSG